MLADDTREACSNLLRDLCQQICAPPGRQVCTHVARFRVYPDRGPRRKLSQRFQRRVCEQVVDYNQ
eukprot:COSAG02_NODE_6755_length_3380_cov_231.039317_5_plen_66_part_00